MEYTFDELALSPLPAGTNVLVMGDSMGGLEPVVYKMLASGHTQGVGTALFSTTTDGEAALAQFEDAAPDFDSSRVGVIDCADTSDHPCVRSVSAPDDLTGMSMHLSTLYENFERRGLPGIQTGFISVSTLLTYLDADSVFRFLHILTGNVTAKGGLGLFSLSPSAHEEKAVNRLLPLFDVQMHVERDDGDVIVKVQGADDQPDEWTVLDQDSLEASNER